MSDKLPYTEDDVRKAFSEARLMCSGLITQFVPPTKDTTGSIKIEWDSLSGKRRVFDFSVSGDILEDLDDQFISSVATAFIPDSQSIELTIVSGITEFKTLVPLLVFIDDANNGISSTAFVDNALAKHAQVNR